MENLYSQFVDQTICKRFLSHHKLAIPALYTLSCSEVFKDFRMFPSTEWNVQHEQMCISD
jgi:hypothetical protein